MTLINVIICYTEREKEYPAIVEISQKNLALLVLAVEACQAGGVLRKGSLELVAPSVWSIVHGIVSLLLEQQILHQAPDRRSIREILAFLPNQKTLVEVEPLKARG